MSIVKEPNDVLKLDDNRIVDFDGHVNTSFISDSSMISFKGVNNVLVLDKDATLAKTKIIFNGDNSLVYIGKTRNNVVRLNLNIHAGASFLMADGCSFNGVLNAIASESKSIVIGTDCMFSFGCWMRTSDVHMIYDIDSGERVNYGKNIVFGNHVWLGQDATVLKGAMLGSGSVIALGSIVTKKIMNNSIAAGNPAKLVKQSIFWDRQSAHAFGKNDEEKNHHRDGVDNKHVFAGSDNRDEVLLRVEKINSTLDAQQRVDKVNSFFEDYNLVIGEVAPNEAKNVEPAKTVKKSHSFLFSLNKGVPSK